MFKRIIGFGAAFYAGFLYGLIKEAQLEGYKKGYIQGGLDAVMEPDNADAEPHLEA